MIRDYYDLHISPEGETIAKIVEFAEKLELAGICIAIPAEKKEDLDAAAKEIADIDTEIDILIGAKISAENPEILRKKIEKLRDNADLIIIVGGDLAINRAACENPKVDILSHPSSNRKDSGMDHVMMALAAKNKVAIELNFKSVLMSYSKIRVHVLSHKQETVNLAKHAGAMVIVTSGAKSIWDMRAGRELATLAVMCGMDREKAVNAASDVPKSIVERVRTTKDKNSVMPGVKVLKK